MSTEPTSTTPAPADPIGKLDLHVTGLTGILTLVVLWALQATLFRHSTAPTDLGYIVSTVVSYGVSQVSGHLVRARSLLRLHKATAAAPVAPPDPPEPPASAMA